MIPFSLYHKPLESDVVRSKEMTPEESSNERINSVFHGLWSKAVGTENYNKKEWMEFVRLLTERGIPV